MTRVALLLGLFWNASIAFGCDCVTLPVSQEKRGAEVVFRGTITEIRGGTDYFTALCPGTSLATQSGETLAKLGKGSAPRASPSTKLP